MKKKLFIIMNCIWPLVVNAQKTIKDKGVFNEPQNHYLEDVVFKGVREYQQKKMMMHRRDFYGIDLTGKDIPLSIDQFTICKANGPMSQDVTNTCWSFATTSYFESEIYRQTGQIFKLSEMYTVYWEYVEKAKQFVDQRGESNFAEGSEPNAVSRIMREYGAVPQELYTGLLEGQIYHFHSEMFKEMETYLASVKMNNAWNKSETIETIKSIMNHYMGKPPITVKVNEKEVSPQNYLKEILKLNLDEYVNVTSILEKPYWKKIEYPVADNWWHSPDYYNLPLDDFMNVIKRSTRNGYTISIGGDISESGIDCKAQVALVPSYDIPSEYIDENARQFRFTNKSTTDDHDMHLIGYMEKNGKNWYLMKDSQDGARETLASKNFGYFFYHEDYIKLKMMVFMVHKDMLKNYLNKFEITEK